MRDRRTMLYLAAFLAGAGLLVWFTGRGPGWVAPLILTMLGTLSAAFPRPTPETERIEGAPRARRSARRISFFATVLGVVLLLRSLNLL